MTKWYIKYDLNLFWFISECVFWPQIEYSIRVQASFSRQYTVIMAGSIKSFQFFQKFQRIIGICSSQPEQKQWPLIVRRTILLMAHAVYVLPTVAYSVLEADSFFEYGFDFFVIITIINSIVVYLIFIRESVNILKFIQSCDEFIGKSK